MVPRVGPVVAGHDFNREHGPGLAFAIVAIVNVRAVFREVVLITSAQTGDSVVFALR